jgi:hypothetical protein
MAATHRAALTGDIVEAVEQHRAWWSRHGMVTDSHPWKPGAAGLQIACPGHC